MLKDAILLKSSTVSAIQKTANFYIIDGKCEEGKLLMQVYNIHSFPTIIRTDLSGRIKEHFVGIFSLTTFEEKILNTSNDY